MYASVYACDVYSHLYQCNRKYSKFSISERNENGKHRDKTLESAKRNDHNMINCYHMIEQHSNTGSASTARKFVRTDSNTILRTQHRRINKTSYTHRVYSKHFRTSKS